MVAERRTRVRCRLELVLAYASVASVLLVQSGAREAHVSVTSAMHDQGTGAALEPLFPKTPDELFAMTAERRLLEKPGSESDDGRQ